VAGALSELLFFPRTCHIRLGLTCRNAQSLTSPLSSAHCAVASVPECNAWHTQVNYARSGGLVRAARDAFALLRTARSAAAWADAVPWALGQLADAARGTAPLPPYVQDNALNLLSGILKARPNPNPIQEPPQALALPA